MGDQLGNQIVIITLGFILTTVLGGTLGYYFQTRTWKHQHDTKLVDAERDTAKDIFEKISILMDKRLYRMRLLYWHIRDQKPDDDGFDHHLQEYKSVLYQWNDNLMRNIALMKAYYGEDVRNHLEGKVYEGFARIGTRLEKEINNWKEKGEINKQSGIGNDLKDLSEDIYHLNFKMLRKLQEGEVGVLINND